MIKTPETNLVCGARLPTTATGTMSTTSTTKSWTASRPTPVKWKGTSTRCPLPRPRSWPASWSSRVAQTSWASNNNSNIISSWPRSAPDDQTQPMCLHPTLPSILKILLPKNLQTLPVSASCPKTTLEKRRKGTTTIQTIWWLSKGNSATAPPPTTTSTCTPCPPPPRATWTIWTTTTDCLSSAMCLCRAMPPAASQRSGTMSFGWTRTIANRAAKLAEATAQLPTDLIIRRPTSLPLRKGDWTENQAPSSWLNHLFCMNYVLETAKRRQTKIAIV